MPRTQVIDGPKLTREWVLTPATTLGSSVRARGILLEIRARLPFPLRKALDIDGNVLVLSLPQDAANDFASVAEITSTALVGIESLPVIPREVQDILTITTGERHRWLKDGRLRSIGTRTVRLRGRAKAITFHVFDPRQIEDLLNRDAVAEWREEDVLARAENRRRAAGKAALTRLTKAGPAARRKSRPAATEASGPGLVGWEEFERDGPLR